jgi:hypothetical protein
VAVAGANPVRPASTQEKACLVAERREILLDAPGLCNGWPDISLPRALPQRMTEAPVSPLLFPGNVDPVLKRGIRA